MTGIRNNGVLEYWNDGKIIHPFYNSSLPDWMILELDLARELMTEVI